MEIGGIGFATAFAAGVVSFLSPCVLPLLPAYLSFVAGQSLQAGGTGGSIEGSTGAGRGRALVASGVFVLGFASVFVLLGAGASAAGGLLLAHRGVLDIVAGIVVAIFGLALILPLPVLQREWRFHPALPRGGRLGAVWLLGAAFAFGWTPCIGPILGAILALAATGSGAGGSVAGGAALLAVYALGLGLPFVLAAAGTDALAARLRRLGRLGRQAQIAAGVVLVAMGAAMASGRLSGFAFWLLETFPFLSRTVL